MNLKCQWLIKTGRPCGRVAVEECLLMDAPPHPTTGRSTWFRVAVCKLHAHRFHTLRQRFTAPWESKLKPPIPAQNSEQRESELHSVP